MAWSRIALVAALSATGLASAMAASPPLDFNLGANAEGQACRAQARFDGPPGARQSDVYCGEWERPSGRLTVMPLARRAEALAILQRDCQGAAATLSSGDFTEFTQVSCSVAGTDIVPRYGMIAVRGQQIVVGAAFPADWSALVTTGRVMTGAQSAAQASGPNAETPGLREIQAVFPAGAPGLSAASNYELLRRRAYEKNAVWNFGGSQTDFSELLSLHRTVAPQDNAGEAELLAELALNLSDEERFDEARETLDQARALATRAREPLLVSKIENYRALDLMNQRQYAQALEAANAANAMRGRFGNGRGPGVRITASDVQAAESRGVRSRTSALLFSMGEVSETDRAAILSAQGSYLAGVASAALHRPDADSHFNAAIVRLNGVQAAPAWLKAQIHNQMALSRIDRGDAGAAIALAQQGIEEIRTQAPSTRTEAHLLLTLGKAQRRQGQLDQALATERAGIAIFAGQRERPGMPGDVVAEHLGGLLTGWERGHDPALANEYVQVMSLVWDGAAARSATQLAARLASREAGAEARRFQDAEREYRAALARRQRISIAAGTQDQRLVPQAESDVRNASQALQVAEGALRARSPRFLELMAPTVSADELRGVLEPGEAYVRLVVTQSGGYGALVTREGITPYRIALNSGEADLMAEQVRASGRIRNRRLRDFDVVSAWRLYSGLFGPIDAQLAQAQRLQVDVGGVLAGLPMSALVTAEPTEAMLEQIRQDQDYSQVPWLSRRIGVAQSVGSAAFVRIRHTLAQEGAPAQGQASIFGNFSPSPQAMAARLAQARNLTPQCREEVQRAISGLGALPETAGEAQQVAALFGGSANVRLGQSFTDQSFMTASDVTQANVLVLATHGVLGLSTCLAEPALIASLGPDGDGLIDASELLDRQLHARLVVLSACDTAGGARSDVGRSGLSGGGEALSGLARGFLYAGASSVLATQWKVDSESSADEVMTFFQAALRDGQPLSSALQSAQRHIYEQDETGHPFYWAAFTLIGDGSARLRA
jgi:CHAT domain-containing protein